MNYLGRIFETCSKTLLSGESLIWSKQLILIFLKLIVSIRNVSYDLDQVRGKKVKAKGSTRNVPKHSRPKHRGWKVQDGCYVSENKILVTQRDLRFHPGLNVS